jgi:DNA-binding CsgD family transcriptional regulator
MTTRYVINKILTSDDDKLTQVDIADQLGVSRITANVYLSEIREKLKTHWRN